MRNAIVWFALIVGSVTLSGAANLTVTCLNVTTVQVGGTLTCSQSINLYQGTPNAGTNDGSAEASSFGVSATDDTIPFGIAPSGASASATGFVEVVIAGGTGAGVFQACPFLETFPSEVSSYMTLAGVTAYPEGLGGGTTCFGAFPFVYGVPQVLSYEIGASAYGRYGNDVNASWDGSVQILNANPAIEGTLLTAQIYDVTTPEPSTFSLVGVALSLAAALRKRNR